MNEWYTKTWTKVVTWLVLAVLLLGITVSSVGLAWLYSGGYFGNMGPNRTHWDASAAFSRYLTDAHNYYTAHKNHEEGHGQYDPQWEEAYLEYFDPQNSNFYFGVFDQEGNILFSGGRGSVVKNGQTDFVNSRYVHQAPVEQPYRINEQTVVEEKTFSSEDEMWEWIRAQYDRNDTYGFEYELMDSNEIGPDPYWTLMASYVKFDWTAYTLVGYIREDLSARDGLWQEHQLVNTLVGGKYLLVAAVVFCSIAALAAVVVLFCGAGRKYGVRGIHLHFLQRIPWDLYLTGMLCVIGVCIALGVEILQYNCSLGEAVLSAGLLLLAVLFTIVFLVDMAARIKAKTLLKNTLIWKFLYLFVRLFRYLQRNLNLYWKFGLVWTGVNILELMALLMLCNRGELVALWFFYKLALTGALVVAVVNMQQLRRGAKNLAGGELDRQIDMHRMFWEFRRHAEDLNAIGGGMQKAVEERMKSERLKTELITNVSHDIKTPLTSIVNYVDLMKKEPLEPPKAREYLEVLDRQSARLKKLTEDLVEASKASTGNMACTLEVADVNLLLHQVLGEYEEKLRIGRLEPVLLTDPKDPKILADGRLLWRVFDNLLSNVCKYAMPGTRVYLASGVLNGRVTISFKNISNYALNITPDELMERFVRGDESRSTEGSGLGLSIAKSLTTLQGGEFDLVTDGDLFKASVSFALVG